MKGRVDPASVRIRDPRAMGLTRGLARAVGWGSELGVKEDTTPERIKLGVDVYS